MIVFIVAGGTITIYTYSLPLVKLAALNPEN